MRPWPEGGRHVLVVGGSRGIGAAAARLFAAQGDIVHATYHRHAARAERLVAEIDAAGGRAEALQLDVCDDGSLEALVRRLSDVRPLRTIVLAASGGLEADAAADYADQINRLAPLRTARRLADRAEQGASLIYLTSHEAHFHGSGRTYEPYRAIAASKKEGELALLSAATELQQRGMVLKIVCADLVEGSYTAKLLERADPGHIARWRSHSGRLPTSEDVAREVVHRAGDVSGAGEVSYVFQPGPQYAGRPRHAREVAAAKYIVDSY